MTSRYTLSLLAEEMAVCRFSPDAPIPDWATRSQFFCVMRTVDELSVVCGASLLPAQLQGDAKVVRDWRALKLHGPFPFEETGVLVSILEPLAAAGISIFALSTFDTDYVLVRQPQLDSAIDALRRAGHVVAP